MHDAKTVPLLRPLPKPSYAVHCKWIGPDIRRSVNQFQRELSFFCFAEFGDYREVFQRCGVAFDFAVGG